MATPIAEITWATAADTALLSDALSHYGPDSLTYEMAAPVAAGDIRLRWSEPDQVQGPTYGAMLAADALYRQADRLWRRNDRAMAGRTSELGLAMAGGRLVLERLAALPEITVQISAV